MANVERENTLGFVDKRRQPAQTGLNVATPGDFVTVAALRARLNSLNATYYDSARLDRMGKNDMVYALRVLTENSGI